MHLAEAIQLLEIQHASSRAEVDVAYRKLVRVWHPDRFPASSDLHPWAEEKLKRINEAYELICTILDAPEPAPSGPTRSEPHRGEHTTTEFTWSPAPEDLKRKPTQAQSRIHPAVWVISATLFIGFLGVFASAMNGDKTVDHPRSLLISDGNSVPMTSSYFEGLWSMPHGDVLNIAADQAGGFRVHLVGGPTLARCEGALMPSGALLVGRIYFVHATDMSSTQRYAPFVMSPIDDSTALVETDDIRWDSRGRETGRGKITFALRR